MISSRVENRSDSASPRPRKRGPRVSRACEHCRARKVRCDGQSPCSGCRVSEIADQCVYRAAGQRRRRTARSAQNQPQSSMNPSETTGLAAIPQLEHGRQQRSMNPYESTANSPLAAVGQAVHVCHDPVQYKRLRELRAGIGVSNSDTGSFQFYGPSSHYCFVQRVYQRINRRTNEPLLTPQRNAVPDGVEKWGLERFMFSVDADDRDSKCPSEAYLSREMGDDLVKSYFDIIHPQIPVLVYSEVMESWENFWKPPNQRDSDSRAELLFMVLALGARVSSSQDQQDASLSEGWADHFARKATDRKNLFEDSSLRTTHFFLLKAMYAYQVMRPNDAYLYLGHAARIAVSLGLNRAQVVEGANPAMHRLRLTFWNIYAQERLCALYSGRPSGFRDELIDAPYPEDLTSLSPMADTETSKYLEPAMRCGLTRAHAILGRLADRISVDIYSLKNILSLGDLSRVYQTALECDIELESMTRMLPPYLHFFDDSLPVGEKCQEVQRTILGNHYYLVRMLMHRPAQVFATFFNSKAEAAERAAGTMDLQHSIDASIFSAKSIVELNYDAFFHRFPGVRFDGSFSTFLVSACVTLLYDVLDSETTPEYARNTFTVVERGIKCLDQIQHVGPTNGKALSMDVMKVAKDALRSSQSVNQLDQNVMNYFPWLQQINSGVDQVGIPVLEQEFPASYPSNCTTNTATVPGGAGVEASIMAPEVNYVPHWLEAGFQPQDIPNCLH